MLNGQMKKNDEVICSNDEVFGMELLDINNEGAPFDIVI